MTRPILVLGGTGLLGHRLVRHLAMVGANVAATHTPRSRHLAELVRPAPRKWVEVRDIFCEGERHELVHGLDPACVVNCIGITPARARSLNDANVQTIMVNAVLPHLLAEDCALAGSRLILISTDCVNDASVYGATKKLGEMPADLRRGVCCIRTSFVGSGLEDGRDNLLDWLISAAQDGRPIVQGWALAGYSGLTTGALAGELAALAEHGANAAGNCIRQLPGPRISKCHLLEMARDALGLHLEIEPVYEPVINRRIEDDWWERDDREPPTWAAMLEEWAQDLRANYPWRRIP